MDLPAFMQAIYIYLCLKYIASRISAIELDVGGTRCLLYYVVCTTYYLNSCTHKNPSKLFLVLMKSEKLVLVSFLEIRNIWEGSYKLNDSQLWKHTYKDLLPPISQTSYPVTRLSPMFSLENWKVTLSTRRTCTAIAWQKCLSLWRVSAPDFFKQIFLKIVWDEKITKRPTPSLAYIYHFTQITFIYNYLQSTAHWASIQDPSMFSLICCRPHQTSLPRSEMWKTSLSVIIKGHHQITHNKGNKTSEMIRRALFYLKMGNVSVLTTQFVHSLKVPCNNLLYTFAVFYLVDLT